MRRAFTLATTAAASLIRAGHGTHTYKGVDKFKRPDKILTLYIKESCPFSRKVREGFSELDLDMNVRPCPKKGKRFRPQLTEVGGKEQVPLLLDPNQGVKLYESEAILKHIFNHYGPGEAQIPFLLRGSKLATRNSQLATLARMVRGNLSANWTKNPNSAPLESRTLPESTLAKNIWETESGKGDKSGSGQTTSGDKSGNVPATRAENGQITRQKAVRLFNYEGSGNCRIVRETLDSLEIPYYVHNIAKGSPKREEFKKMTGGKMQVPFLIDENTGKQMFESEDIVKYLYETYSPRE